MEAYGLPWRTMSETQCVAHLLTLYRRLSQVQGC